MNRFFDKCLLSWDDAIKFGLQTANFLSASVRYVPVNYQDPAYRHMFEFNLNVNNKNAFELFIKENFEEPSEVAEKEIEEENKDSINESRKMFKRLAGIN
jgi:hypothetical protein